MIDYDAEVDTWAEVGAVGTAVVVTPIKSITKDGICKEFPGEPRTLQQLHDYIRALQVGDETDRFGWLREIKV